MTMGDDARPPPRPASDRSSASQAAGKKRFGVPGGAQRESAPPPRGAHFGRPPPPGGGRFGDGSGESGAWSAPREGARPAGPRASGSSAPGPRYGGPPPPGGGRFGGGSGESGGAWSGPREGARPAGPRAAGGSAPGPRFGAPPPPGGGRFGGGSGESGGAWSGPREGTRPSGPRAAGGPAAGRRPWQSAERPRWDDDGGGEFERPAREKRPARPPRAPMLPSCYGCGAALQDAYDDVPGYVDAALLAEKRLHRQLDSVLCSRCRLLAQGDFLPVVQEASTGLAGGRAVITPQQLREQLKGLADRPALIVKLVDMTDVSGSFLTRVRSLVGRNPLILVGTKADLLPKGTDGEEVKQWLAQTCDAHGLTVIGIHLISSRTGAAVDATVRAILSERKGRDVFVLGAANVGKSLFIQAFLKTMAAREGLATLVKYQPLASATPGTTLGMIALDVFSGGSCLHDTPGVHLHHRVTARLPPDDVKALAPRAPLRGIGAPVSPRLLAQLATGARGRRLEGERGWSVLWGGFLRVDLLEMPACARLVFFGPKTVTLRGVETAEADAYYEAELGRELTPPATAEAARGLGVMEEKRSLEFRVAPGQRTIDVAVSGLGWFSVVGVQQSGLAGDARIRLWSPRAVELFVRKPMPVRWADFEDSARDAIALDGDGDDDDGFDALGFEGDEFDEDELD